MERTNRLIGEGVITETQGAKFMADLECCLSLDRFDFAMLVQRRNDLLVMKAVL
jgi:hypothetical protein